MFYSIVEHPDGIFGRPHLDFLRLIKIGALSGENVSSVMYAQQRLKSAVHHCRLIRVLVVRMKKLCILGYPEYAQWKLWSDYANTHDDWIFAVAQMCIKKPWFKYSVNILTLSVSNSDICHLLLFCNKLSLGKKFICKVKRLNVKQRRSWWDG